MAYFEGTLSGTQTGLTVMAAIKTALDGNLPTGWSFVEEWTESSTTWHVYKCAAAQSGLPDDFHFVMATTSTGDALLGMQVCEGYDTSAHRMIRPHMLVSHNSTGELTSTPPSDGLGGAGSLNALWRPGRYSTNFGTNNIVTTSGTSTSSQAPIGTNIIATVTNWAVFVYADGIAVSLKSGTNNAAWYAGKFASLVKEAATNDPMPVVIAGFEQAGVSTYTTQGTAGATRSAMNAGVSGSHGLIHIPWHIINLGNPTVGTTFDKYAPTSGAYLIPYMLVRYFTTNRSTLGGIRGRMINVLYNGTSTGLGWGDTITVGSDTYQYIAQGVWARKTV